MNEREQDIAAPTWLRSPVASAAALIDRVEARLKETRYQASQLWSFVSPVTPPHRLKEHVSLSEDWRRIKVHASAFVATLRPSWTAEATATNRAQEKPIRAVAVKVQTSVVSAQKPATPAQTRAIPQVAHAVPPRLQSQVPPAATLAPAPAEPPLLMAVWNGHRPSDGEPLFSIATTDTERTSATTLSGRKVELTEDDRHTALALPAVLRETPLWLTTGAMPRDSAGVYVPMQTENGRTVHELFTVARAQSGPAGDRFTLTSIDGRHAIANLAEQDVATRSARLPLRMTGEQVEQLVVNRYERLHDDRTVKPTSQALSIHEDLAAPTRTRGQGQTMARA